MHVEYKSAFVRPARGIPGVIYEPVVPGGKSRIGVLAMHCEADYLDHTIGPGLAKRGYTVLCANTHDPTDTFASKLRDVGVAMSFLRSRPGIEKVIVMGHSGGATLMSAYQNLAENGVKTFQGPEKLIACPDWLDGLTPADGFMSLDSNWGNGAMRLFSTDPAVMDERGGLKLDPELDMFSPKNGWTPEGSHYSEEFMRRFFLAQHERNSRITAHALERLSVIEAGKGFYADDEPLIIPGAALYGFNNKLFPQDTRLFSHTKQPRTLVHNGGGETVEIVPSLRHPRHMQGLTGLLDRGALHTSVKKFLDSWAVRTDESYHYNDSEAFGILWDSSFTCTPGNVSGVTVPTVVVGMTANWEFSAVETIYNNAAAGDKTCAFIEGADHDFHTDKTCERYDGEFGDTTETTYDFLDKWLSAPGRFD